MRDLAMPGLLLSGSPRRGPADRQPAPAARAPRPRPARHPRRAAPRSSRWPGPSRRSRAGSPPVGPPSGRRAVSRRAPVPAVDAAARLNIPRAISRAAVRMKSLKATGDARRPRRSPSSSLGLASSLRGLRPRGRPRSSFGAPCSCSAARGVLPRPCGRPPRAGRRASRGPTRGRRLRRTSRRRGLASTAACIAAGSAGAHQRLRRPQPGPRHRGRCAALVHHRHDASPMPRR